MASLTNDNRLRFMCPNTGQRKTLRLGDMSKTNARAFRVKVERLIDCIATGEQPDGPTRDWLRDLPEGMRNKLAGVGLLGRGNDVPTGMADFIKAFIAANSGGVSQSTSNHYKQAGDRAEAYFGKTQDIRTITAGAAIGFSNWLRQPAPKGAGLGENTARDRCKNLRTMFNWAIKCETIGKNPFSDEGIPKAILPAADDRVHLIPVADAMAILEACRTAGDYELAAMFVLCRWGGLRAGETRLLTWEHIDFERNRFTVLSPKTANKGKGSRVVPLFPEIAKALLELQAHAPEREPRLFPYYAGKTQEWAFASVKAAIKRAGVADYKRPWHNLRVTRITELVEIYPEHVVNAWVGNTKAVSVASYRKVTEGHFAAAAGLKVEPGALKVAAQIWPT